MPKNVISDTNLFYELADKKVRVEDIKAGDETLCCSPLSLIEIVSKMDEGNFEKRRNVVRVVLDIGAKIIEDPQSFVTQRIFGHKLNNQPPDWYEIAKAVAGSKSLKDLATGVVDLKERKVRTVSVDYVRNWREVIDEQWKQDLLDIMRDQFANFDEVYKALKEGRKSVPPKLRGEKKKSFLAFLASPEWYIEQLRALHQRSLHYAEESHAADLSAVPQAQFVSIISSLFCYMSVYNRYIQSILTEGRLPTANDSGDMELFLYATDDNTKVATMETKWPELAKNAGYEQRAKLVKVK